ncbi:terminase [Enterococcus devriesei]|uniref:terminase n=1 Tax=Enterococcus devriesei TaxID=319970 RepID=UPI0036D3BAAC
MPVLENARYEKFVQCLITGMSQRKAYREAFRQSVRWKDNTVDSKASDLLKNGDSGKVQERYKELQEQAQDAAIMTRKERMVALSDIARGSEKESDMIKAIDTLNKMDGNYQDKILNSAQIRKVLAEAAIIENTANKLTQSGKVNELLQSLLDVKSGGDGSG